MVAKILERVINFEKMSYVTDDNPVFSNHDGMIDCALGINPFGYSEKIGGEKEKSESYEMNQYPAYPYNQLKMDIAKFWEDSVHIDPKRIVIGAGTMGLLSKINKLFIDEQASVLGYCPQFSEYISDMRSLGGNYEYILLKEEQNLKLDVQELIAALDEKHSLVYVDNPNNPTGQIIPLDDLKLIAEHAAAKGVCVIVDEAYGDFMEKANSALNIVDEFDNVFVLRSLSKGFGMAGIRVGYMVCSEELQPYYQKIDLPFSVTNYGEAMARIALSDYDFVLNAIDKISQMKKQVMESSTKLKVMQTDLTVPIMVLRHPDPEVNLHAEFLMHGVLTEAGSDFMGMGKNSVRMRVPKEIEPLIKVLESIE